MFAHVLVSILFPGILLHPIHLANI